MSIMKINTNARFLARRVTILRDVSGVGAIQKCFVYSGTSRDTIPCQCKPRDTVQIRCSMTSADQGYFFGNMNSGCQFAIRLTATAVEWFNGSATAVASKPKSDISFDIPHTYGFLEGRPIFDNAFVDASYTPPADGSVTSTAGYGIGQALGVTSRITEVSVYRFDIIAFAGDTSGARRITRYYPVKTTGNAIRWYDLYSRITQSTYGNSYLIDHYDSVLLASNVVPLADGEQYGIQLDDLRYITRSGYKDLLAILTEDDPASSLPNADAPYVIGGKNFAFKVDRIPSGATASGGAGYANGQIIKGRRPKWNIWHDIIKFGKYATKETSASAPRHIHFNIFKDNKGEDLKDMLAVFDGYTENAADIHEPSFSIDGNVSFEWHNGFLANIAYDDRIVGNPTPTTSNGTDEQTIFRLRRETSGMGRVVLGNLPLWNYTASEQSDGVSNPLTNMRCIGGGVILEWQDGSGWARFASMVEFTEQMSGSNLVPLSSDSNQETIDKFRINGFDGDMFALEKRIDQLRRHFIIHDTGTMNMRANLVLATEYNTEIDSNLIECSELVPTRLSTFNGVFDNRVSLRIDESTSNIKLGDRTIYASAVNDVVIGGTAYELFAQAQRVTVNYATLYQYMLEHIVTFTQYGNAIALPIALLSANNARTPLTLFDSAGKPIIAVYAVVTAWEATNKTVAGRYSGFASMLNADPESPYYNIQGAERTTYHSMNVPYNNDSVKTVSRGQTADAILMWKDLFKNFNGSSSLRRTSNPVTTYVRAFALATAPHAWDTYHSSFDTSMAADSINLSTPKLKFVFHNNDRLIPMGTSMLVGYEVFADMWISLWDTNTGNRVTSQWSKLNGRTIKLYELINDDMHDPSTGRGSKIAELASFFIPNGTFHDDTTLAVQDEDIFSGDDCMCNIQANVTYPDFAILGTVGALEQTNMIHIRITSFDSVIKPLNGAMYYVDIQ